MLTDEEKFLFDLRGFVVVPNVLTGDECEDLIGLADEIWPRQPDDGPFRRARAGMQSRDPPSLARREISARRHHDVVHATVPVSHRSRMRARRQLPGP